MKKLLVMLLMLGLSMVLLAGCGSSGIGVDNYEYRGGWGKANPVQLSGKGKAVDNCISLNKLDFAKVPQMYKAMEDKLKDIEGTKIDDYFSFRYWRGNWYASIGLI